MQLEEILNSYGTVRTQGNRVRVCISSVCRHDRVAALNEIHQKLASSGAVIMHDRPDYSSIGYVQYDNLKISVKSQKQQSKLSPGVSNEQVLVNKIHKYLKDYQNINLTFYCDNFEIFYGDVTDCCATENRKTKRGRNKADMVIESSRKKLCFSIKQKDAERWESADTSCGSTAKQKLQQAIDSGKVKLTNVVDTNGNTMYRSGNPPAPIMRVEPEMYWQVEPDEQKRIIFGDDVVNGGAVLINTFADNDFMFDESSKTLKVKCDRIYTPDRQVDQSDVPYWIVRNDVTRNCRKLGIMGIRIESVFGSRIKYGVEA